MAKGKYHVVAVNSRTGNRTRLTATPVSKSQACTIRGKHSIVPGRRVMLESTTTKRLTASCSRKTGHKMKRRAESLGCGCQG